MDCEIMSYDTRAFLREPPHFCENICHLNNTEKCNCINTHLYGFYESERWEKKYIYYCPLGLIFLSNVVYGSNKRPSCCVITGPVIMEDKNEINNNPDLKDYYESGQIVVMSTERVYALSETIAALCDYISKNDTESYISDNQKLLLSKVYDKTEEDTDVCKFFLEGEKKLAVCISSGDKKGSQELLNAILGNLFFSSKNNLDIIKARVAELVVLLSRAAIDGGAEAEQIFWLNTENLSEIKNFSSIEELSVWLTEIMHKYISFVFDFNDIKHVDVMFKIIDYIKEHYHEKISLDSICEYVFLSKSYLSKIFKEEIGCNFTVYINKIRCEKSKAFLLDNKLSIVDIASLVGFEDQSYFTKTFKKIVGVSPGKFRELRGKI